jgi:hypothetical protein
LPSSKSADRFSGHTWRAAGLRYHALGHFFRRRFGRRVWKVSVDGGFSCPNVDGTLGTGGCIFCNVKSYSPSRRRSVASIADQIDEGIRRLRRRHDVSQVVAYFQPATNTYAPLRRLRQLWEEALGHPEVVGLIVGTRPDCVPDDVLDLLAEFSQRTWLCVEYGLQTIHDRSLAWLNRGHGYGAFLDAVERGRRRGLRIGAHVILGLPCETPDHLLATAGELARLGIDSVKLHNLYVAKGTPLARLWAAGRVELPERDQYMAYVADFLERLPADCVIDRLSADAPREYLLAPSWCLDKSAVRRAIEAELARRDTWQGRQCVPAG